MKLDASRTPMLTELQRIEPIGWSPLCSMRNDGEDRISETSFRVMPFFQS
jgi:hypothetical protein